MEWLVVGDVGYGKTEVALRAGAIAALAGRQVAVAAPTTVLAPDYHRISAGHVQPRLDDVGCEQHVAIAAPETDHRLVDVAGGHLAVRFDQIELGDEFAELIRNVSSTPKLATYQLLMHPIECPWEAGWFKSVRCRGRGCR